MPFLYEISLGIVPTFTFSEVETMFGHHFNGQTVLFDNSDRLAQARMLSETRYGRRPPKFTVYVSPSGCKAYVIRIVEARATRVIACLPDEYARQSTRCVFPTVVQPRYQDIPSRWRSYRVTCFASCWLPHIFNTPIKDVSVMSLPVSELGEMPKVVHRALEALGIRLIGDLEGRDSGEFSVRPGFGSTAEKAFFGRVFALLTERKAI